MFFAYVLFRRFNLNDICIYIVHFYRNLSCMLVVGLANSCELAVENLQCFWLILFYHNMVKWVQWPYQQRLYSYNEWAYCPYGWCQACQMCVCWTDGKGEIPRGFPQFARARAQTWIDNSWAQARARQSEERFIPESRSPTQN